MGLALALTCTTLAAPITRLISPRLIESDNARAVHARMALALIALPIIYLLPLTPVPHAKVIQRTDILSYLLLAVGFGLLPSSRNGRLYWWFEAPWLGMLLALAVVTPRPSYVSSSIASSP